MTVTLHIQPQDYPVINIPQTLEFIYGTPTGKFDARTCTCVMTLSQSDKQILHKEVPAVNNYFGKYTYTFKRTGVYKILLTGTPKKPGGFHPFNLTYNIRVGQTVPGEATAYSKSADSQSSLIRNSLLGVGAASLVASVYIFYTNFKKGNK